MRDIMSFVKPLVKNKEQYVEGLQRRGLNIDLEQLVTKYNMLKKNQAEQCYLNVEIRTIQCEIERAKSNEKRQKYICLIKEHKDKKKELEMLENELKDAINEIGTVLPNVLENTVPFGFIRDDGICIKNNWKNATKDIQSAIYIKKMEDNPSIFSQHNVYRLLRQLSNQLLDRLQETSMMESYYENPHEIIKERNILTNVALYHPKNFYRQLEDVIGAFEKLNTRSAIFIKEKRSSTGWWTQLAIPAYIIISTVSVENALENIEVLCACFYAQLEQMQLQYRVIKDCSYIVPFFATESIGIECWLDSVMGWVRLATICKHGKRYNNFSSKISGVEFITITDLDVSVLLSGVLQNMN